MTKDRINKIKRQFMVYEKMQYIYMYIYAQTHANLNNMQKDSILVLWNELCLHNCYVEALTLKVMLFKEKALRR